MAVWLVVLVLTNSLTLAALVVMRRRDKVLAEDVDEVFSAPRPSGVTTRSRRLITIEVLNPIELVGTRGRMAGLVGSLAPGIARRAVYDQVLKTLRRELANKQVVADVRLHELRPVPRVVMPPLAGETEAVAGPESVELGIVDDVVVLDLETVDDDQL